MHISESSFLVEVAAAATATAAEASVPKSQSHQRNRIFFLEKDRQETGDKVVQQQLQESNSSPT